MWTKHSNWFMKSVQWFISSSINTLQIPWLLKKNSALLHDTVMVSQFEHSSSLTLSSCITLSHILSKFYKTSYYQKVKHTWVIIHSLYPGFCAILSQAYSTDLQATPFNHGSVHQNLPSHLSLLKGLRYSNSRPCFEACAQKHQERRYELHTSTRTLPQLCYLN